MTVLHAPDVPGAAESYLRHAIHDATHHLYMSMVLIAVLTLCAVRFVPQHFAAE